MRPNRTATRPAWPTLSPRSDALWVDLNARYEFSPDSAELCHRGLEEFDLGDGLKKRSQRPGIKPAEERALLSAARDAYQTGLKFMKAVGLDKADLERRRAPGRPPGLGLVS